MAGPDRTQCGMDRLCIVVVAAIVAALAGCTTAGKPADSRAIISARDPASLVILTGSGEPAAWDTMIEACAEADAVLIGECHGQPVGQAFQAKFFTDLLQRAPRAAGALEFFERDEQAALDDFLLGVTDEQQFRRATRRTESNYTSGHRTIVEACRAAGRPVIAANAPRRYVRMARQDGYERLAQLTAEQQRLFVVPAFHPEDRYRDEFFKIMGGEDLLTDPADEDHAKVESRQKRRENIENTFRSQSMWDWTMADSVAREITNGSSPVVLVVGRFHTDHNGGLVQALQHMKPDAKIVTISSIDAWSDRLRVEDRGAADFVVYIGE